MMIRRLVPALTLAIAAFGASVRPAEAQETSRAQALFDDGKRLMNEGHFAEACPKLAASQKLDPGAGTLVNLATCYEKNGQTASAWATFKEASAASHASGHPEWESAARARAEKLEPELARLVVTVPDDARVPGLVVERDGTAIGAAEWATPIPIDSGPHTLKAVAPGKKPWTMEITIAGARSQATVTVPVLENDPSAAGHGGGESVGTPTPIATNDGSTQRLSGIIVGGSGVAAVGVGVIFGLIAKSTYNDALTHCNAAKQCQQRGLDLDDHASTQATVSTIAFVAGAVLLAGGTVLYLTAPHAGSSRGAVDTRTRLSLGGPGLAGVTVGGAF